MRKLCLGAKVRDLTQNFRSHQGVLDVSAAIVDCICSFFRETTDELPREWSEKTGALPLCISHVSEETFIDTLRKSRKFEISDGRDAIVLGDQYVVLVKGDDEKAELM